MKPSSAQPMSERSGRPEKPPPPEPPKRARPRRNSSSSEEIFEPEVIVVRRCRRGGSPHGPAPLPSSVGGSAESPEPHGPLSVNRPRARSPHPRKMLIAIEYREGVARKTVA